MWRKYLSAINGMVPASHPQEQVYKRGAEERPMELQALVQIANSDRIE